MLFSFIINSLLLVKNLLNPSFFSKWKKARDSFSKFVSVWIYSFSNVKKSFLSQNILMTEIIIASFDLKNIRINGRLTPFTIWLIYNSVDAIYNLVKHDERNHGFNMHKMLASYKWNDNNPLYLLLYEAYI